MATVQEPHVLIHWNAVVRNPTCLSSHQGGHYLPSCWWEVAHWSHECVSQQGNHLAVTLEHRSEQAAVVLVESYPRYAIFAVLL